MSRSMSSSLRRSLILSFAVSGLAALAGCSAELGTEDAIADAPGGIPFEAAAAVVGEKARVTATALNLRSGPNTTSSVLTSMPSGSIVDVLDQSGTWYKVRYNATTGWCSGEYLTPASAGGGSDVDAAIERAKSGVGFSYWWGGGCWKPGASEKGSCTGACPGCTHRGTWGADCSGYVAKVWQVPGASSVSSCGHPYSTANFDNEEREWNTVPRSSARRGDAFVYNTGGAGHIFLFESGDPWGSIRAYEAKGCSYGIVHGTRTAGSDYKVIRRKGY